jgi:hypothetical protein
MTPLASKITAAASEQIRAGPKVKSHKKLNKPIQLLPIQEQKDYVQFYTDPFKQFQNRFDHQASG